MRTEIKKTKDFYLPLDLGRNCGSGESKLTIVTSPSKQEVLRHFGGSPASVELLRARGKDEQAAKMGRAAEIIHPVAVIQDEPLGLGHAVGLAESALDADEDYFVVMLVDDVIESTVAMSEMIRGARSMVVRCCWLWRWTLRRCQTMVCSISRTLIRAV